jgi:ATP-dependent Clp protease ATP-binding subunit ClpC
MPKINVYLPDDLADAVKDAGLPVSAICQRALEQSVRRVAAIRSTALGDLGTEDPTAALSHFTQRVRSAITSAIAQAKEDRADSVGTEHLLYGLLAERGNLALRVLGAIEIDPEHVAKELGRVRQDSGGGGSAARFGGLAANALELTVTESVALGHNYVGCEHLLLGLVAEPDGTAGQVLRGLGAELRSTRRAVVAALAGYVHLRAQGTAGTQAEAASTIAGAVRQEIRPLIERIERLERQAGLTADA